MGSGPVGVEIIWRAIRVCVRTRAPDSETVALKFIQQSVVVAKGLENFSVFNHMVRSFGQTH